MLRKIGFLALAGLISLATFGQKSTQDTLSVCFAGDLLLDRGVRQQIGKSGISPLFEKSDSLFLHSDFIVVNLECPVTEIVAPINKKYIFRGEPKWLPELKKHGITHAGLANNHSMDQGRRGLADTFRNLNANGIVPLGYGRTNSEASKPIFLEKNGIKVAVFNLVRVPLENWTSNENEIGVCQLSADKLALAIAKLKKEQPKTYVVIFLHWGVEFQKSPTLRQRHEAHQLIDAGADAIVGHHPHVIQKTEEYRGKPIFFSLGNFIFDQSAPATRQGLVVKLLFNHSGLSFQSYEINSSVISEN